MIFFFGSYYARFKKEALPDVTCPNCGRSGSMYLSAGCRTYHVMFIPIAPGSKKITQRCGACKSEFLPFPEAQEAANRMAAETRRPPYLYFWLLLIGAFILFVVFVVIFRSNGVD